MSSRLTSVDLFLIINIGYLSISVCAESHDHDNHNTAWIF